MRYEFYCEVCEVSREVDRSIPERDKEGEDTICLSCNRQMQRAIGNKGGFRLLGSGWERDGYSDYVGNDPRYSSTDGYGGTKIDEF